jgi:hypothetical protein
VTHGPVPGLRPGSIPVATGEIDRALNDLAAALPGLPLAKHHDRLAGVQGLLQRALDEARADR